jgi:hypothetical protein
MGAMVRRIRRIEIYLPLEFNDGRTIPGSYFVALQRGLLKRYGGVTSIQRDFPLEGIWQSGKDVYQDRVIVFSVMDFREDSEAACLAYLNRLKGRLKKTFNQLEVLITVADLLAI